MNELKKSMPGGLQLLVFYVVVPCSVYFMLEFEASPQNTLFVGRWGKGGEVFKVEKYFSVEVKRNLSITLMIRKY